MTNNEIEDERNNRLKTAKNEQKYCNNNGHSKWNPSDLDEHKKKVAISEVVLSAESNNTKNDNITSDNSENDDLKENESILKDMKDNNRRTTMNLRKFRRATAKKQILDNMAKCSNKLSPNHQVTEQKSDIMLFKSDAETTGKTRKRKLSGNENIEVTKTYDITKDSRNDNLSDKDDLKCQKLLPKYSKVINNNQNIDIRSEQPKVEAIREEMKISDDSDDQCTKTKIRTITENSENSSMTLQQFTDIVLASEGMSMAKHGKKSENTSPATPSTPQRKDSLQSSCGGDDEASNSIPTNFSSVLERKVSTESVNKISCCDTTKIISSNLKSPSKNLSCNVKLEQMDNGYGCNNNILDSSTHNAMVANIMNNKDLTVEVKPIRVKPVVLSPRHPHGHNYNFQVNTRHYENGEICSNNNNPWHSKSGQHSSLPSNGRYYSSAARPRIQRYDSDNSSCSGDIFESKSSPLPKGRPPSIPKMVEEWFKKMQPPQMEEDDNHYDGHLDNATSDKSSVHANQSQPVPRKHQLILREPPEIRTNTATVFQTDSDSNTVLNLSTKDCKKNPDLKVDKKQQNPVQKSSNTSEIQLRDSNTLSISKPTQVYLRPIPTNQMTHNSTTNTTTPTLPKSHLPHSGKQQILALHDQGLKPRRPEYEQIVILGRHNRKEQYSSDQNRRYCNPVEGSRPNTNQTNVNYYHKLHPGLPAVVKNGTTSVNNNINPADNSRQILSPPNLEITRIPSYPKHSPADDQPSLPIDRITRNLNDCNLPNPIIPNNKNLGRSFTLESSNAHRESIKARAIRDIQLAHTKDLHGNYPIHMSVLMRKPELVKRYCCVLQILESTIDLQNDDKLTPLHLAIRDNSLEIIELLLAFGADPALRDNKGNSGLHVAAALGASACLQLLAGNTKHKEDLNELNDCGITPLQISMMNSDKISTDILIRSGANLKLVDPKLLQSKHGSLLPLGTATVK